MEIKLSNSDKSIIIDDCDFELLKPYRWYLSKCGRNLHRIQIRASAKGKDATKGIKISPHRLIMSPQNKSIHIDHIDGDVLNNKRSNLRLCSNAENSRNRAKLPSAKGSRYKGVRPHRNKWRAFLKGKHIGLYEHEYVAAIMYDIMAKTIYGEFARCNILENGAFCNNKVTI